MKKVNERSEKKWENEMKWKKWNKINEMKWNDINIKWNEATVYITYLKYLILPLL